jgi:hypothetical protein
MTFFRTSAPWGQPAFAAWLRDELLAAYAQSK